MYNEKHPQAEGTDFETHSKFFWTPFWTNSIPEWVDDIDNACQVHLDIAHEREKDKIEKQIQLTSTDTLVSFCTRSALLIQSFIKSKEQKFPLP